MQPCFAFVDIQTYIATFGPQETLPATPDPDHVPNSAQERAGGWRRRRAGGLAVRLKSGADGLLGRRVRPRARHSGRHDPYQRCGSAAGAANAQARRNRPCTYCLLPICLHVCSEAWLCGLLGEHRRPDTCFHATAPMSTQTGAPFTRCLGPCVLCAHFSSCARREFCQPARGQQAALDSERQPRTARFGQQLATFGRYAAIDGLGRLQ